MSKSATVFILDVSKPVQNLGAEEFNKLKECILLSIKNKMFTSPKDEISLLLMGSKDTNNPLNDEDEENYQGINMLQPLIPVSLSLYTTVKDLQLDVDTSSEKFNLLEPVVVAIDMIKKKVGKKKYEKKIILLTAALDDVEAEEEDEESIKRLTKTLSGGDISFFVVGLNFTTGNVMTKNQGLVVDILKQLLPHDEEEDLSDLRFHTTTLFKKLFDLYYPQKKAQRPSKFDFKIHSNLIIPVDRWKKSEKLTAPKVNRFSRKAFRETNEEDDDSDSDNDIIGDGKVNTVRTYTLLDDPDHKVAIEDTIKAHKYGSNVIPVSKIDEEALKLKTTKQFDFIGTIQRGSIPRHYYIGESYFVTFRQNFAKRSKITHRSEKEKIFDTLVKTCLSHGFELISRLIFRKNSNPKIALLSPFFSGDVAMFIYNEIPYMEDIRHYAFDTFDDVKVKDEDLEVMENFINKMDLTRKVTDDDEEESNNITVVDLPNSGQDIRWDNLNPEMLYNPVEQYFNDCVFEKALKKRTDVDYQELPEVSENILEKCMPEVSQSDNSIYKMMIENGKDEIQKFEETFEVFKVDENKNVKRKFQLDRSFSLGDLPSLMEPPVKKRKTGEGEEFSIFEERKKILSADPVNDFEEILEEGSINFEDVVKELGVVIITIINNSIGGNGYPKALESIESMRAKCIGKNISSPFNLFLKNEVKEKYGKEGDNHHDFWTLLREKKITLITKDECNDSNIEQKDANDFILTVELKSISVSKPTVEDDEEMFEDIV